MACTIFIGNLPWGAAEDELRRLVATVGKVEVLATKIARDEDGRSRGFAFLEVSAGPGIVAELEGKLELGGRDLNISYARSQKGARQ